MVEGHKSRVEGHRSRVESRGRGSKVEVEGQKSRVEIFIHFKSFTTIKRGKTISFAVKTEKFRLWLCRMAMPYGYVVWLCRMAMPYGYVLLTESFACGTKSLMRGLNV